MKDRRTAAKKTRNLTLTALLAALGVVLLLLGSVVEIMDLTVVFLVSLFVVFALIELGEGMAFALWLVTSFLSILLIPNKMCAFEYALLGGTFPLIKYYAERLPRVLAFFVKFVAFNLLFAGAVFVSVRIFGMEEVSLPVIGTLSPIWYFVLLFLLGDLCFFIYDWLITRLIPLYFRRIRPRLERFLDRE